MYAWQYDTHPLHSCMSPFGLDMHLMGSMTAGWLWYTTAAAEAGCSISYQTAAYAIWGPGSVHYIYIVQVHLFAELLLHTWLLTCAVCRIEQSLTHHALVVQWLTSRHQYLACLASTLPFA